MEHSYTNKLINETSPYLLQHAHNPVNWFPWGDEALLIAKKENKPILVSIGYAACHWCHVMERESFEDEATAKIMNESFINIKIDREERPDLDHIYMDAVQAMTGSGGWPLNVFLTPEAKPFFGGTYFPPQKAYNRPSWQETLLGVKQAFQQRRHEMDAQAENLTQHLLQSNSFGNQKIAGAEIISEEKTVAAFNNIMKSADKDWGGFGKAPKFPQAFVIQFLLRFGHIQKQASGQESLQTPSRPDISKSDESKQRSEEAITQALLSLDKMIEGGIYDPIGGGFSRYSTDTEWLVPHFEKMLYDNALLLSVLSEAYQLTKADRYKEVIEETMNFIQRELVHPQKGFYASLDADSEGVEGKFYVWDIKEIKELLGEDADLFCRYYAITEKGNWEEKNILQVLNPLENFAIENKIAVTELKKLLEKGKKILLEKRNTRIRPLLDDKIILGWNALMNSACSKAFGATGNEAWKQLAIQNMEFILQHFVTDKADAFYHTWKNGTAKYPAFLDDYAYLIQALLNLQEITGETKWLKKAKSITSYVIENFSEPETGYFFYTSIQQRDVIVRKKEVYDGAVPSGNSIMAYNLHHLSILFDKKEWEERSLAMIMGLGNAIITYPTSFGNWACLLLEMITGTNEIVIMGSDNSGLQAEIHQQYIHHRIIMSSVTANPDFPLLAEKDPGKTPSIFLCRNYTCKLPVFSVKDLISLINKPQTG